jgi:ribosomal protein S27AE
VQPILTDREVQDICYKIESGRLKPSIKTHINHIQHVKEIVEQKHLQSVDNFRLKDTDNACPKCGEGMVLRTAKRGDNQGKQFWGCSGFPKCRTIKRIT